MDSGRISVETARRGDLGVGLQSAFVGQRRHRCAHRRMHAVRAVQEVAALGGQRAVIFDQPAQRGSVDRLGMRALADLRQLLRVAEQQQVGGSRTPRRSCWPDRIGRPRRSPADPGCPAGRGWGWRSPMRYRRSRTLGCAGDESGVLLLVDLLPRGHLGGRIASWRHAADRCRRRSRSRAGSPPRHAIARPRRCASRARRPAG